MKIPARFLSGFLWLARIALAAGFLSASADRFGWWGPPGAKGVAWGNWQNFVAYSASLNSFAPDFLQGPLAIAATCAEVLLGIGLLIQRVTSQAALLSGLLLLTFGLVMAVSLGVKAPLDYSVFSASAAAFLLSLISREHAATAAR